MLLLLCNLRGLNLLAVNLGLSDVNERPRYAIASTSPGRMRLRSGRRPIQACRRAVQVCSGAAPLRASCVDRGRRTGGMVWRLNARLAICFLPASIGAQLRWTFVENLHQTKPLLKITLFLAIATRPSRASHKFDPIKLSSVILIAARLCS